MVMFGWFLLEKLINRQVVNLSCVFRNELGISCLILIDLLHDVFYITLLSSLLIFCFIFHLRVNPGENEICPRYLSMPTFAFQDSGQIRRKPARSNALTILTAS